MHQHAQRSKPCAFRPPSLLTRLRKARCPLAAAAGSCNDGIRVLAINPGLTASDRMVTMMRSQAEKKLGDPDRWEELLKDLPFERAAKSEEVADLTTFLVSPRCSYISGTVITIDGGHSNQ